MPSCQTRTRRRQRTSSSNSSVWPTHRPPEVLLPLKSSHLEEDTAAWFGSLLQSDDLRLFCGMVDGLAFLTVDDLQNGMHLLRTLCPADPPEAAELLDYLDSTYISGSHRCAIVPGQGLRMVMCRTPSMFPPAIWNIHEATVNGDLRTNNVCEGWNNKFLNLVGYAHPSIWRVIEWCQKEEATVHTLIQQDSVGNPPVKRVHQRYVQLQQRLNNLCRDLTSGNKTIVQFLLGVGWNIRLNH